MNSGTLIGWLGFATLAAAVVVVPSLSSPDAASGTPSAYVQIVDKMIDDKVLKLADPADAGAEGFAVVINPSTFRGPCPAASGSGAGKFQESATDAQCSLGENISIGAIRDFARHSYLADDMKTGDSIARQRSDYGLKNLENDARSYRGPSTAGQAMKWDIRYDPADSGPRWRFLDLDTGSTFDLPLQRRVLPCQAGAENSSDITVMPAVCHDVGPSAIGFMMRDGNILLDLSSAVTAEVDRRPATSSVPSQPGLILTLTPASHGGQVTRLQLVEATAAVARSDDRGNRLYDESLKSIADHLEGNLLGPVQTTLRESVQIFAEDSLRQQLKPAVGNAKTSFQAGAVLMNGLNGEIVALPTFPLRDEDLVSSESLLPTYRRWLDKNTNFANLPIGSAAKVIMASAILHKWPDLAKLTLRERGGFNEVAGVHLRNKLIQGEGHASVDFTGFIANSSNQYALTLMTLGLADGDTQFSAGTAQIKPSPKWKAITSEIKTAEQIRLNGQVLNFRPPLAVVDGGQDAASAWRDNLWYFFCVDPGKPLADADGDCGDIPWQFADKTVNRDQIPGEIGVDPPHLDMSHVSDLYNDYAVDTLGQERSQWTTIQLAQSYARIVADKKVKATLVKPASPAAFGALHDLGLDKDVRQSVMTAMSGTIEFGTASRALRPVLNFTSPDGKTVYRYYAKTGTPTTEYHKRSDTLKDAIDNHCLKRVEVAGSKETAVQVRYVNSLSCTAPEDSAVASDLSKLNSQADIDAFIHSDTSNDISFVSPEITDVTWDKETHAVGLVIARVYAADETQLCSLSVIAANIRYRDKSDDKTPALTYVKSLLSTDTPVKNWIERPCELPYDAHNGQP